MKQRNITDSLVIHCSATAYGNVEIFRKLHLGWGWEDIGYHFVINNCYPTLESWEDKKPIFDKDGFLEIGRPIEMVGAHVKKHNYSSIGICLVGDRNFTAAQFKTLKKLINDLFSIYKIRSIKGHYEYDSAIQQGKTCPNIDMDYLRKIIKADI